MSVSYPKSRTSRCRISTLSSAATRSAPARACTPRPSSKPRRREASGLRTAFTPAFPRGCSVSNRSLKSARCAASPTSFTGWPGTAIRRRRGWRKKFSNGRSHRTVFPLMKSYPPAPAAGWTLRSARVAKWQTQQTQNLPGCKPRVGSSPTSGTNHLRTRRQPMNRFLSIAVAVLLALPVLADEDPPQHPNRGGALHYLITTDHVLAPGELEADGVEVQHVLPGNRYLVRAADAAALGGANGVRSVELYAARAKMSREGWRSAASSSPFVTINVLFHDDTTFDAALAAVEAAGGTIETPLAVAGMRPQPPHGRHPPAPVAILA